LYQLGGRPSTDQARPQALHRELRTRGVGVGKQARLECGVGPRVRYDPCAAQRADVPFEDAHQRIDGITRDQTFFDEQRFDRLGAQRRVRRRLRIVVAIGHVRSSSTGSR
jgi:hypothetical protein